MTKEMSKELTKEKGQTRNTIRMLIGVDKTIKIGHYMRLYQPCKNTPTKTQSR
jgi:hypothetical protein